jgi:hypothetical protein
MTKVYLSTIATMTLGGLAVAAGWAHAWLLDRLGHDDRALDRDPQAEADLLAQVVALRLQEARRG